MRIDKLLLVLLLVCMFAQSASAQSGQPGEFGVFADPTGTQLTLDVIPFAPMLIYVVAFEPPEGIAQYWFALDSLLATGASILGVELPEGAVNAETDPGHFDVTVEPCVDDEIIVLARLNVIFLSAPPNDTAIYAVGLSDEAGPESIDCGGNAAELVPVPLCTERYPDGALILNATHWVCPVGNGTFGSLKAAYEID